MQITEFTIRIILLFTPGILLFAITEYLTAHKDYKNHDVVIWSFLSGIFSYVAYYLVITLMNTLAIYIVENKLTFNYDLTFFRYLIDKDMTIDVSIILKVSLFSILLALIFSYLTKIRLIYILANRLGISGKIGDVWSYALEKQDWVVIRDLKDNRIYEGWLYAFSESWENTELFLLDVKIYENSTGNLLRELPGIMLTKPKEELIFEFPVLKFKDFKYIKTTKGEKSNDGKKGRKKRTRT